MSSKLQLAGTKPDRENRQPPKEDAPVRKPTKSKYIFNYGRALEPKLSNPSLAGYYRPWRFTDQRHSGLSKIFYARTHEFRVSLDISQFPYENISVKVIEGRIVIDAYHGTIEDQLGKITRRFVRKYKIPPDVKASSLHGKYKRGFLFIWGEKSQADVEESDVAQVEEKMKTDRIVSSKKNARILRKRHTFIRNDVKSLVDGRLDKHAAAQFRKPKQKRRIGDDEITIPIAYSPRSPV